MTSTRPAPNLVTRNIKTLMLLVLCLAALFRLWLTADRDIAGWNAPHDEFWYVHKAYAGIWTGEYDELAFVHLPTYALWLQLLNTFGVPARLGIDLAWIGAVAYLAKQIVRVGRSRIAGLTAALFLLLHPYTIYIFDRSLAETFLAVCVAVTIAAALNLWAVRDDPSAKRRVSAALVLAVAFALSCNLRKESVTLIAPVGLLLVLSARFRATWWAPARPWITRLGTLAFILPLVAAFAGSLTISALNYAKWGTFVAHDLDNVGYRRAVASLAAIDTGRNQKHVLVTKEMMRLGYGSSPTLRELAAQFDGPVAREWVDTKTAIGANGDIGTGWFYWALRDAAARTGWHSSARHAGRKYQAVSDELERAFSTGNLSRRTSFMPAFVDPDAGKWLPDLPVSVGKISRVSILPYPSDLVLPPENAEPEQFLEYVRAAGRRDIYPPPGPDDALRLADAYRPMLTSIARALGVLLVGASLVGVAAALAWRRSIPAAIAAVGCLGFAGARIVLFAVLDASSWNGEQPRYMLAFLPFLGAAGALGLSVLMARLPERARSEAAANPA